MAMSQPEQYPDGGLDDKVYHRSPSLDYDIPEMLHAISCMSGFGIGEYIISMCLPETVSLTAEGRRSDRPSPFAFTLCFVPYRQLDNHQTDQLA